MPHCLYYTVIFCFLTAAIPAQGADLYQRNLALWQNQAKDVSGREFKFLIDANKLHTGANTKANTGGTTAHAAFREIWNRIKTVADQQGIPLTERETAPFVPRVTVKTFFDTKDMDLMRQGCLIRLTVNYKNGSPVQPYSLVVKAVSVDFRKALAANLESPKRTGDMGRISTEENISQDTTGRLSGYLEKGVHFTVSPTELDTANIDLNNLGTSSLNTIKLADFETYVPKLLRQLSQLGLPADTVLLPYTAFGLRCRPGFVTLPGLDKPVAVSMEAWAHSKDGVPAVYDFSWSYAGDYASMAQTHAAAETFLLAIYAKLNDTLGFGKDVWQYKGSKVQLFFKHTP